MNWFGEVDSWPRNLAIALEVDSVVWCKMKHLTVELPVGRFLSEDRKSDDPRPSRGRGLSSIKSGFENTQVSIARSSVPQWSKGSLSNHNWLWLWCSVWLLYAYWFDLGIMWMKLVHPQWQLLTSCQRWSAQPMPSRHLREGQFSPWRRSSRSNVTLSHDVRDRRGCNSRTHSPDCRLLKLGRYMRQSLLKQEGRL
jgi:hypothetical protein